MKLKPGIRTKRGRIYGIVWAEQVEQPPWIMTTVRERERDGQRMSLQNGMWLGLRKDITKIEAQLIHQIGSLFIMMLEGKKRSLNVKSG